MKVISKLVGISAVIGNSDELLPISGTPFADINAGITARYKIAGSQPSHMAISVGSAPLFIPVVFQTGTFETEGKKIGITQITLSQTTIAVMAIDTEGSDLVLDDIVSYLNESFGFRFFEENTRRVNACNLVVEFSKEFSERFIKIAKIERAINEVMLPAPDHSEFRLKRLSFGRTAKDMLGMTIETAEYADFIIERRANQPFETNRFFCSAALKTAEHVRTLEKIEQILMAE